MCFPRMGRLSVSHYSAHCRFGVFNIGVGNLRPKLFGLIVLVLEVSREGGLGLVTRAFVVRIRIARATFGSGVKGFGYLPTRHICCRF